MFNQLCAVLIVPSDNRRLIPVTVGVCLYEFGCTCVFEGSDLSPPVLRVGGVVVVL